ncbi:hypothetical protein HH310_36010 [Actinoplanes sp. TBRC 11911]|uniref:hypothetical protein n=1 Tax=Actinoplanes sp. TBRC 11911 TaxID=2729386 RepID=UPI00145D5214|nr:hypothetical protein [Actinoplanes sp. TBRC 11911]NMO56567.1 hypothetical protein [Actinoplanes sp. TBRC 11911]
MSSGVVPELGNLAWAPLAAIEELEIYDRYNGVPTLGVFRSLGETHMFWRAVGYTGDISFWLYVPLAPEDEQNVEDDEGPGLLDGIVFRSTRSRFATVGVANLNRLVFEREWNIPAGLHQAEILKPLLEFVSESLTLVLREDLASSRREVYQKAETVVRQLVTS